MIPYTGITERFIRPLNIGNSERGKMDGLVLYAIVITVLLAMWLVAISLI